MANFPIVLTREGDALLHYPGSDPDKHPKLETCVGVHAVCAGWVDIRRISQTHSALTCRACGLRVPIPNRVSTYNKLQRHFRRFNPVVAEGQPS